MSYKFGDVLYDTSRDYYAAIAQEWLSAGGQNSRQFVRETFAEETDEDLADEVLELWEFDGEPGFDPSSLVEAFADHRATANAAPVEDDEATNHTCGEPPMVATPGSRFLHPRLSQRRSAQLPARSAAPARA
jgi:hypothetical protein